MIPVIYTPLTKLAMKVAYSAHEGQLDKSGVPYIYHPMHVAEQMTDETAVCAALLHDVVEDTAITLDDLRAYGFGENILEALSLLTHREFVPYMEYVAAIKENPIACAVKIADLSHNSDLTRLDTVDEAAKERLKKYRASIEYLKA